MFSVSICGIGKNGHHLSQEGHSEFLRPGHHLKSYIKPEKAASVMCLDAVLGKVHLPCWRFIVVPHDRGRRKDSVLQMSRHRHKSILPQTHFSRSRRLESSLHTSDPLRHFLIPGALKCWCATIVTPVLAISLTRQSGPLLFFPRGCTEDNCMLSVPLSSSDLHKSCWQSGENCQVVSAGAFTLLCHAFWFSLKRCSSLSFSSFFSLAHAFVCSLSPVL